MHTHTQEMKLGCIADVLRAPDQFYYFVCSLELILIYFVNNVSAIVSYDRKELLDIRTVINSLDLDEDFYFNESAAQDILLTPDQALIPDTRKRKRQRYRG